MLVENIDQKIILTVQNMLALDLSILPQCDKCYDATDMFSVPHKIKIIALISHTIFESKISFIE